MSKGALTALLRELQGRGNNVKCEKGAATGSPFFVLFFSLQKTMKIMIEKAITEAIERRVPAGPSFGAYTDVEQDKYYAYYIGKQGRLLLLSKPYSAERYADSALRRFKARRFNATVCEDDSGWFLEVRTEGGKLFATSPRFETENEATLVMEEAQAGEAGSAPQAELPKAVEVAPRSIQPPADGAGHLPRYSFRLDFYKAEKGAPARGRIAYSITQENEAFQGLDMEFIRSFVSRHLQAGDRPKAQKLQEQENDMRILVNGKPALSTVLMPNQDIEVELVLDVPEAETFDVFVYAKSLEGQQQTLAGRKRGKGGPVRLNIFLDGLQGGLYRLTATVHLTHADSNLAFSSPLFHLLAEPEPEPAG